MITIYLVLFSTVVILLCSLPCHVCHLHLFPFQPKLDSMCFGQVRGNACAAAVAADQVWQCQQQPAERACGFKMVYICLYKLFGKLPVHSANTFPPTDVVMYITLYSFDTILSR